MFSKVFCYSLTVACLLSPLRAAHADGPADNQPEQVRPIPPKGIELEPSVLAALSRRCKAIRTQWQALLEQPALTKEKTAQTSSAIP